MSTYGFVYCLGNNSMPGIYKLGCTERSPRERAEELSKPSGVPEPFDLLFFIEVRDFQAVEKKLHEWLDTYRVNVCREFFRCDVAVIARMFYFHPSRLSFCDATERAVDCGPQQWGTTSELQYSIQGWDDHPAGMWNPFDKRPVEKAEEAKPEPAMSTGLRIVGLEG